MPCNHFLQSVQLFDDEITLKQKGNPKSGDVFGFSKGTNSYVPQRATYCTPSWVQPSSTEGRVKEWICGRLHVFQNYQTPEGKRIEALQDWETGSQEARTLTIVGVGTFRLQYTSRSIPAEAYLTEPQFKCIDSKLYYLSASYSSICRFCIAHLCCFFPFFGSLMCPFTILPSVAFLASLYFFILGLPATELCYLGIGVLGSNASIQVVVWSHDYASILGAHCLHPLRAQEFSHLSTVNASIYTSTNVEVLPTLWKFCSHNPVFLTKVSNFVNSF